MRNLLTVAVFLLILIFLESSTNNRLQLNIKREATQVPSEISISPTSSPTKIIYKGPTPTPIPWGQVFKIDEHISSTYFAPDDHMSTADELFAAMNQYRSAHNIPTLGKNDTLCKIAQSRADELKALGKLDNHDGFAKYVEEQQEFSLVSEVLFGGGQPVSGVHIVEWGWDRSLTGHKEAISDPRWHDGCAGVAGYFAVFIFAQR